MDALIPFVEALDEKKDLAAAVKAAVEGARSTEGMGAKFGRASYLGEDKKVGDGTTPMDPGAWAAAVFLRGLEEGFKAT